MTTEPDHRAPVTVFETGEPGVLAVAKSLLEGAGISFFAKGEGVQDLFAAGSVGGFNPVVGVVQVQVPAADAEQAKSLLADLAPATAD